MSKRNSKLHVSCVDVSTYTLSIHFNRKSFHFNRKSVLRNWDSVALEGGHEQTLNVNLLRQIYVLYWWSRCP